MTPTQTIPPTDPQQEALSRRIAGVPPATDDAQAAALAENRAGADALAADAAPTIRAMSNTFELERTAAAEEDPTQAAMSERRVVVDKAR